MNVRNKQSDDIKVDYAFALCTVSKGIWETKKLADSMNVKIEKEKLCRNIELFFGSKMAAEQRSLLGDDSIEEFCLSLSQLKEEMDAELRQAHLKHDAEAKQAHPLEATRPIDAVQNMLSRLRSCIDTIRVKFPVRKLLVPPSPPEWSSSFEFAGDLRGKTNASHEGVLTSQPIIEPSLYIEEAELKIHLRLLTEGCVLPETKEAISLFVDGKYCSEFEFVRDDIDTIWIVAKIDDDSMVNPNEMSFDLYYSPDLKEISIVVGDDPN